MFWTRLASGVVLVILALAVIITGGPVLAAVLGIVSLIGLNEVYKVIGIEDGSFSPMAGVGYLGAAGYYVLLYFDSSAHILPYLIAVLILVMSVYVFTFPRYRSNQATGAFFGVVYVAVMLSYIFQLRQMENGKFLVWLIFLASWGCDTCAYCVGVLIGKHKMSPKLSPKKSVEGAVGGVVGATLLGVIYASVISKYMSGESDMRLVVFAVICAVGALVSMVGDLAASAIKRNHDIKDYGKLIPGHGGILDRFDSVIFIAPVIFYLAEFFGA